MKFCGPDLMSIMKRLGEYDSLRHIFHSPFSLYCYAKVLKLNYFLWNRNIAVNKDPTKLAECQQNHLRRVQLQSINTSNLNPLNSKLKQL